MKWYTTSFYSQVKWSEDIRSEAAIIGQRSAATTAKHIAASQVSLVTTTERGHRSPSHAHMHCLHPFFYSCFCNTSSLSHPLSLHYLRTWEPALVGFHVCRVPYQEPNGSHWRASTPSCTKTIHFSLIYDRTYICFILCNPTAIQEESSITYSYLSLPSCTRSNR